jgi:Protein involved in beta-1,3-glucan synthesis
MWIEFFNSFVDYCNFKKPVTQSDFIDVEKELNVTLPGDLKSLLCESDGVEAEYRIDLIWSLEKIRSENLLFRKSDDFKELYMPFDCLLFFGDAGNGDQFAYSTQNGELFSEEIYVWNHEDDSRTLLAPSLKEFVQEWLDGSIEI